jgi:hypothetical protein
MKAGGNFALSLLITLLCSTGGIFTVPLVLDSIANLGAYQMPPSPDSQITVSIVLDAIADLGKRSLSHTPYPNAENAVAHHSSPQTPIPKPSTLNQSQAEGSTSRS